MPGGPAQPPWFCWITWQFGRLFYRWPLLALTADRWQPSLSTSLLLTEQLTPRALGDGNDRRMFESALDGDGIEPFTHLFQTGNDRYAVLEANAGLDG